MKNKLVLLLIALALTACGDSSKIKDAVRERVKDPGSAQFKDVVVSDGKFACIVWNAKNSMGGYGDWKVAELRKVDNAWNVSTMEGYSGCSEEDLKVQAIEDREKYGGAFKALQIVQKVGRFSAEDKLKFSAIKDLLETAQKSNGAPDYYLYGSTQFHACAKNIHKYADAHASIAKAKAEGRKPESWAAKETELQTLQVLLETGSCA